MSDDHYREQLLEIRRRLKFSQRTMATQLGLSLRAYQALEAGESAVRSIHVLAAENVALTNAVVKGNPFLLSSMQREEVKELAAMLASPILLFQPNNPNAVQAENVDQALEFAKSMNIAMALFVNAGRTVSGEDIPV
jgi:transcriptional regulator with XRE-family HTH domain